MATELFDVLIVEWATSVVESVAGKGLTERAADRREATVLPRLNDRYGVVTAPTGRFPKGSVWAKE
jgi:hypothetical protein